MRHTAFSNSKMSHLFDGRFIARLSPMAMAGANHHGRSDSRQPVGALKSQPTLRHPDLPVLCHFPVTAIPKSLLV
jgi:hypothetical protein